MNALRPSHLTPSRSQPAAWLAEAQRIAALTLDEFAVLIEQSDTRTRRALYRARFRFHVREFAAFCLPDVVELDWNRFHTDRLDVPKVPWDAKVPGPDGRPVGRETVREADAAPRGIAKSTTEKIDALHDVVYGLERFVLVLSAGNDDAMAWADTIRGWLEEPTEALAWLYGPFTITGGKERFRATAKGQQPCAFACRSFRSKVRGINDATVRPTKVVVDDGEDRKRVLNPKLRDEDRRFTTDDVLKVGARQGGLRLRWVGTVLHKDAQLALMLRSESPLAGWRTRIYKAVESWPTNDKLWDHYVSVYTNVRVSKSADVREAAANAFYRANKAAMDEGVRVLDPQALPIDRVYRLIANEGRASVLRELQNEPVDPSRAAFDSSTFKRCRVERGRDGVVIVAADGRRVRLDECRRLIRWDPTPAQSESGDYAAIVVLARDDDGYTYVLDGWIGRASKSAQYAKLWSLAEAWGYTKASVESNGFQIDDFHRQVADRRAKGKYWQLQLDATATTTDKVEDICALDVPAQNGWLQFADVLPKLLFDQFDAMTAEGSTDHDDGPDAVARGYTRIDGRGPSLGSDRFAP